MRRRAAALAIAVLAAAGCGGATDEAAGDGGGTSPTGGVVSPVSELGTVPAEAQSEEGARGAGSVGVGGGETAPGSVLNVGDTATVAVHSSGRRGVVEATVVDIARGDPADLSGVTSGTDVGDATPYYVTLELRNVGDVNLPYAALDHDFHGRLADGSPAADLGAVEGFRPCESEPAPDDFSSGRSFETCRTFLTSASGGVTSVAYEGFETPYAEDPVIWRS